MLEGSFRHYNIAYAKTGSYYTGINAAALSLLLGARKARALAERVLGDCLQAGKPSRLVIRSLGTTSTGWQQPWRGRPDAGQD